MIFLLSLQGLLASDLVVPDPTRPGLDSPGLPPAVSWSATWRRSEDPRGTGRCSSKWWNPRTQEVAEKPQSCVWISLLLKVKGVACVVCCVELVKGWLKSRIALKLKGWNRQKPWSFEVGWSTMDVAKMLAELTLLNLTSFTHWNSPLSKTSYFILCWKSPSLTHFLPQISKVPFKMIHMELADLSATFPCHFYLLS
jgi:hypothetical protein